MISGILTNITHLTIILTAISKREMFPCKIFKCPMNVKTATFRGNVKIITCYVYSVENYCNLQCSIKTNKVDCHIREMSDIFRIFKYVFYCR